MTGNSSHSAMKKLSVRNLKMHKVRNLFVAAMISIITLLITSSNILGSSTIKNMERTYLRQYGSMSHVQVEGLSKQNTNDIINYTEIKEYGKSIPVGNVVNDTFSDRPAQMRYGDINYAESVFSRPEQGRMPEKENEAALDTSVLKERNLEAELGTDVKLQWRDREGKIQSNTFQVVGIWEGKDVCPNRMIWVSEKFAVSENNQSIDMALYFKKADKIEAEYTRMSEELGLNEIVSNTNWVYDSQNRQSMGYESIIYKLAAVLVLICGAFILYSIVQISVASDVKLYGRMKAIGVTPRQIKNSLLIQMHMLALPGILSGLILGYFLGRIVVPQVVRNTLEPAQEYAGLSDFVSAAVLVYFLVIIVSIRAAGMASKVNPYDIINGDNSLNFTKKSTRRTPGLPALFQMSLANIGRYKKRYLITILVLSGGLTGLSCIFVINSSFDIEKYMEEAAISDFTITEKSLINSWGAYNTQGNTISEDIIDLVERIDGIKEKGYLYSQTESIHLSADAYQNITEYYEQDDRKNLEYMKQDKAWSKGYGQMKKTKTCMAVIFGVDSLILEQISEGNVLAGTIDKGKFLQGGYVIANGFAGESGRKKNQPTYSVGSKVEIGGNNYEVMAIAEIPYPITEGKVSDGAEFSLAFFIPNIQFKAIYPGNTIRKLFFNVNRKDRESAEEYAEENFRKQGIPVSSRKTLSENYKSETRAATMMQNIVVIAILAIGLVSFWNAVIVSVNERKKEFAVMQGLGMTKKQLKSLLFFESVDIISIILVTSYCASFIAISTVVKAYLSNQWTAAYHFTITPLLLLTPVLILFALAVPLLYLGQTQKGELMDRLEAEGV